MVLLLGGFGISRGTGSFSPYRGGGTTTVETHTASARPAPTLPTTSHVTVAMERGQKKKKNLFFPSSSLSNRHSFSLPPKKSFFFGDWGGGKNARRGSAELIERVE